MTKTVVQDFMTSSPVTARQDMTLAELVELFDEYGRRGLAVTDEAGKLVGIVTETDLFLKAKGIPFSIEKIPTLLGKAITPDEIEHAEICKNVQVHEVMSKDVVTVTEDVSLERVAMLMHSKKVTLVPVVRNGEMIGEVRRIQVLKGIYCDQG